MTLKRDWIPSPNYSSRGGSSVRLVVVHTAEGALTYDALGNYFDNPAVDASSHVGIDSTPGRIGEYVKRPNKAWTQGDANPYSDRGRAVRIRGWTPPNGKNTPSCSTTAPAGSPRNAATTAYPIRKLSSGAAMNGEHGVCGHVDISGPGGHWDPGNGLPWSRLIDAAKSGGPVYGPPADAPSRPSSPAYPSPAPHRLETTCPPNTSSTTPAKAIPDRAATTASTLAAPSAGSPAANVTSWPA